jgi:colanic acid biosynthesis protein WcaH
MPERVDWVSDDDWKTIVSNAPIVSVDLVVLSPEGIVFGYRTNEPATGQWFIPGGRVHKGERLEEAVHRVASEELGVDIEIRDRLGVYEHLYETADVDDAGGKHYIPIGFVVETDETNFTTDDQHGRIQVFPEDELPELHEYVEAYLRDAGILDSDNHVA